jgi:DnaK suppressor protein
MMTGKEKETLENHIREKIHSLKKNVVSYRKLTRPIVPDDALGRLTRMDAIGSKSINEAALRKAEHTLSRLEHTLKMMDDPDFGLCAACEEPIPFARLMIMPEAYLCVECAETQG